MCEQTWRVTMDYENYKSITWFHWEPTVIFITTFVSIILLGTIIAIAYPLWNIRVIILSAIIFIPLIITLLYCPLYLKINNGTLIIRQIKGEMKIPITEIKSVTPINKTSITSSIRVFGSGGLFGYLGIFKNNRIGKFHMYATELTNLYTIQTSTKTYVICCRNKALMQHIQMN